MGSRGLFTVLALALACIARAGSSSGQTGVTTCQTYASGGLDHCVRQLVASSDFTILGFFDEGDDRARHARRAYEGVLSVLMQELAFGGASKSAAVVPEAPRAWLDSPGLLTLSFFACIMCMHPRGYMPLMMRAPMPADVARLSRHDFVQRFPTGSASTAASTRQAGW